MVTYSQPFSWWKLCSAAEERRSAKLRDVEDKCCGKRFAAISYKNGYYDMMILYYIYIYIYIIFIWLKAS